MSPTENRVKLALCVVSLVAIAAVVTATAASAAPSGKEKFLIMSPHTKETCLKDLDAVMTETPQLLDRFEWGCMAGDHTGYLIVEAKNEEAAREMLPTALRKDARIIPLNKFTADQIRSYHQK